MSDLSKEEAVEKEMERLEEMRGEMASMLSKLSDGDLAEDPDVFLEEEDVLDGETLTIEIDRGFFSLLTESIEDEFMGTVTSPVPALLYSTLFLDIVGQHQDVWMESIELADEPGEECDCPKCSGEGTPEGIQEVVDAGTIEDLDLDDDSGPDGRMFQ